MAENSERSNRANSEEAFFASSAQMNLIETVCPNCQAPLTYNGNLTSIACNYCGTSFAIDDLAATADRIMRAQSDAKHRDMRTQLEYEKEHIRYDPVERERERQGKRLKNLSIALAVCCVFLFIIIFGMNMSIDAKKAEIDKRNEAYVEQAHDYIEQGDFDNALLVANRIDGDRSLSWDQDDRWDAQREELVKFIKEKQKSNA